MNLSVESGSTPKVPIVHNAPSILSANWLYLISMLLIISVGAALQSASFGWGLLATEFLLILLPALGLLYLQRLPLTETLRLHWPGWAAVGLGLAAGIGLWLVDAALDMYMMTIFGYTPPTTPDTYPVTIGQAILVFVALAIAAPLCEEILFRGTVQRAYERRGRKQAFIITSLLFAFFHFRLQGLVALLPVAFTLGYLRMRSNSLWPAVAAHFSNNAIAAIFLITAGLQADWLTNIPLGSPLLVFVGLVVMLVALWLFTHLTSSDDAATAVPTPSKNLPSTLSLRAVLPLGVAALLYLGLGGFEFIYGRMPELTAVEPLTLKAFELDQETQWEYDIRNALDESVGQATCGLIPANTDYVLDCQTDVRAFKVELPGSTYQSGNYTAQLMVRWRGDDLNLIAGDQQILGDDFSSSWQVVTTGSGLSLVAGEGGTLQTLPLPDDALLPDEWPWRLMAYSFGVGSGQRASYVWPSRWQPETQSSAPAIEEMAVVVSGAEPVITPAGNFIAWRVKMSNWTAWYDVNAPHTLVQYDAGFATYVLTAVR